MFKCPLLVLLVGVLAGCAHAPTGDSPEKVLDGVCSAGSSTREIKGMAWLSAKSKEASGRFGAAVHAVAPDQLTLEVLQPFGAALATLTIHGTDYRVTVPGKPENDRQGRQNWGGIPLHWATDLFLGKIPCPAPADHARVTRVSSDLLAETSNESFRYQFESGHLAALHWSSSGKAVDFKFSDFDAKSGSPEKWQAVSTDGEVKLHWQDREVVR